MNTLVKITIPLLILMIISGCVRHTGHYSAYPDDYYYDRGGYNSYYSNPVYYDRHVYVQPPIYNDRHNSHRRPHNNYSNKPQKPNLKHGYNGYQQSSKPNIKRQTRGNNSRFGGDRYVNKPGNNGHQQSNKPNLKRQTRGNNSRFGGDRQVNKNNLSNKSYKNHKKPVVNNSFSKPTSGKSSKGNGSSNYSRSQPTFSSGSKFGKSQNTYSPQRQHSSGKSNSKR